MSKKHFHRALDQLDLHKKTKEVEIPGILGFTVNQVQVVDVPYRPGYVYVRLRNNTSEVIQAFNENTNALYNLPVIIVRDEVDRSRYKVKGRDLGAYQNWGTANLYVGDHTHSFFTGFTAFDDGVFQATGVALDFKEDIYATALGTTISVGVNTGTFSRAGHIHSYDIVVRDNALYKVTGTVFDFTNDITVLVTGTTAYVSVSTGTFSRAGHSHPEYSTGSTASVGGASNLLIYEDSIFKVTGTALNFTDNLNVLVSGSVAHVSVATGSFSAPSHTHSQYSTGSATSAGTSLLIYDDGVFKATGTSISFNNNLTVDVTGTAVYVSSPITTYQRVAQPIPLASVTGTVWQVPDRVYASGSLAIFQSGLMLTPVIDFQEQLWVSGTYFLSNVYSTGTVFVTMYGVPCVPQAYIVTGTAVPTSENALLDSNGDLLLDSNGDQLLDSNG